MAIFGYGRVSTAQQDTENQRLELEQAGWTFDFWFTDVVSGKTPAMQRKAFSEWHCCKVSDEAAFCLIQRPYISKTLLTRRISPRGSP